MFALLGGRSRVASCVSSALFVSLLFGVALSAQGQVTVTGEAINLGPNFQYFFSVTNNTAEELAFVSVFVPDVPFTITSETAPTGFTINGSVVNNSGYVNFLQDLDDTTPQSFAPGATVEFFAFVSQNLLSTFTIDSLTVGGTDVGGATVNVSVIAPEPATLALTLPLAGFIAYRRKRMMA